MHPGRHRPRRCPGLPGAAGRAWARAPRESRRVARGRWWSCALSQLAHRGVVLLSVRRGTVESWIVLHEGDALALHRVEDHASRLPAIVAGPAETVFDLREVVAVEPFTHLPAEGAVL